MESVRRPLIYGEVLFDCFENGDCVLGGAPFNVAWHLQGFGLAPYFVSRIGRDDLGKQVREAMHRWKMDTRFLQEDPQKPTGRVRVALKAGQPSFQILPDQAYDHIDPAGLLAACAGENFGLMYHGSLIARTDAGWAALEHVKRDLQLPVFMDINLRDPWWRMDRVTALLDHSRWLKLNDDELTALAAPSSLQSEGQADAARRLLTTHGLDYVVVTLGAEGGLLVKEKERWTVPLAPVSRLADTVGAGDGFSAVMILGLMRDWDLKVTLRRANTFAAAICAQKGATAEDPSLYRRFLEAWQ
ncbi:MAG: carbohydrate kinase [Methylothermaceae bacterium]|nr:carbohydrate kinase [Methylothermaceae bacterium]